MEEIKLWDAPESNRAEIGPSELAIKWRGNSKKGVSVCPVTLDRVALGIGWHILSFCVAVSARVASRMVGCCSKVAAACAVLYVVGYYVTVTEVPRSRTSLGMLLQVCCCIQDAAATAMAVPPKFPEAKSRGTTRPLFAHQFP